MKMIWVIAAALCVSGCAKKSEDPKVNLVQNFWQAMQAQDVETVKQLMSDPEQAMILENGHLNLAVDSFKVLDSTPEGVNVKFSRHCYPDMTLPTILTEKDGVVKVDFMATFQAHMKQSGHAEPTEQYCYKFKNEPMQGVINDRPWQADHVQREVVDFGTRKSESVSILAEPCPQEGCVIPKNPSIIVSNLDFSGVGGNFNHQQNITIYTPPSDNRIITQGSYRISSSGHQTKLEISFQEQSGDYVNGYILY
ncbi:hypothetical protein HXZ60_05600 [Acinetobacter towneri]|uniref:hypothetical protein n=1 Tax=Acinetobacter towneri TaxID=202956 RepID=UPI00188C5F31|nr:hypothetical protein [Acinetobacter towneri]MBF4521348.1 hypothetical protein [Acinetobacter towneri]MDM1283065.1 hypothetical protein [Acinetobacter towneri]